MQRNTSRKIILLAAALCASMLPLGGQERRSGAIEPPINRHSPSAACARALTQIARASSVCANTLPPADFASQFVQKTRHSDLGEDRSGRFAADDLLREHVDRRVNRRHRAASVFRAGKHR